MLLKPRQRHHRIIACDAGDRSEKRRQPALGDKRGDLGTEAAGPCSFVHDDAASSKTAQSFSRESFRIMNGWAYSAPHRT